MKAAIYTRKSTEQADVAIRSVVMQGRSCHEYAEQHGFKVDYEFADDGVSGGNWQRPGLDALYDVLNEVDLVLVEEQKALARDYRLLIGILGDFEDAGVQVHSVREGHIDISTFEGQVIVGTRGAADAKVRQDASVRGIRTFRQKFLAGHAVGYPPYGFTTEPVVDENGKSYKRRAIVPEQAEVIVRVFGMFADEGHGHKTICKILNAEGVACPEPRKRKDGLVSHNAWAPSTLRDILRREAYLGIFHYNRTENGRMRKDKRQRRRSKEEHLRIELPELRIVDEELWGRVQARREEIRSRTLRLQKGRLGGRPPREEAKNLLAGMMLCAFCKGSMVCETSARKGHRKAQYVCGTRKKGNHCENWVRISAPVLEEAVLSAIEEHALTPEAIERVVSMAERDDYKEKLTLLQHEQETNAKRVKNLVNAVAEGAAPASLVEEIQRLESRQAEIAAELKELKPFPDLPLDKIESQLEQWRRQLRGSVTQGRLVIQKIIKGRILMIPCADGVGYEFRAPTRFDKLFQGMALPMPKFLHGTDTRGYEHLTPADTHDADREALLENARLIGIPDGTRTRVAAVKGRSPRPLDDGDTRRLLDSVLEILSQARETRKRVW